MRGVRWFRRKSKRSEETPTERQLGNAVVDHLSDFVTTRRGVEAWLEEPTNFNKPSILLVAADGESTRRAIPSIRFGYEFADTYSLPAYDAGVVPYPKRLRDYGLRQRRGY